MAMLVTAFHRKDLALEKNVSGGRPFSEAHVRDRCCSDHLSTSPRPAAKQDPIGQGVGGGSVVGIIENQKISGHGINSFGGGMRDNWIGMAPSSAHPGRYSWVRGTVRHGVRCAMTEHLAPYGIFTSMPRLAVPLVAISLA